MNPNSFIVERILKHVLETDAYAPTKLMMECALSILAYERDTFTMHERIIELEERLRKLERKDP